MSTVELWKPGDEELLAAAERLERRVSRFDRKAEFVAGKRVVFGQ